MEVIEKVAQKDTGSLPGPGSRGASERRAKSALCVGALQEELCDIDDDIRERREPNNALLVNCCAGCAIRLAAPGRHRFLVGVNEPDLRVATLHVNRQLGHHVVLASGARPDLNNKRQGFAENREPAGLVAKLIPVMLGDNHDIGLKHRRFWTPNAAFKLDAKATLRQLQPQLMTEFERHVLMIPCHPRFLRQNAIMQFSIPLNATEQESFKFLFGEPVLRDGHGAVPLDGCRGSVGRARASSWWRGDGDAAYP